MLQQVWMILLGAFVGALLVFPVRLICSVLLKRRGQEMAMARRQMILLASCLAVSGGVIAWRAGVSLLALYLFLLLVAAACVAYIDASVRLIPNELVLSVIALSALFGVLGVTRFQIWSSLLGLVVSFVVFFLPSLLKQKIGAGDVKFAAAMGFALGLTNSLYAIACMGALVLIYLVVERMLSLPTTLKTMIPMGPFLAAALVIVSVL